MARGRKLLPNGHIAAMRYYYAEVHRHIGAGEALRSARERGEWDMTRADTPEGASDGESPASAGEARHRWRRRRAPRSVPGSPRRSFHRAGE